MRKDNVFLNNISEYRAAIMGLAMISILLFHQKFISGLFFVDFFHEIGHWGVDVFLFVSGMGMVQSLSVNSIKDFYLRRIKRLLAPCIIAGVLKTIMTLLGMDALSGHILYSLTNLNLWFVYAIICYYLLSPILHKLIMKYGIIFIVIISCLCLSPLFDLLVDYPYANKIIPYTIYRLPVFCFGMYVAMKLDHDYKSLILSFICLIFVLYIALFCQNFISLWIFVGVMFAVPAICICSILITKLLSKIGLSIILKIVGIYSLEIYLWHEFIFENVSKYKITCNGYVDFGLSLLMVSILVVITHYFVTWINPKIFTNKVLV